QHRAWSTSPTKTGLLLAAVLSAGDIVLGIIQLDPDGTIPTAAAATIIAAGALTLALIPLAWRGATWATFVVIAVRLLSALTGLPALFVADVPVALVWIASGGIALAIVMAVLLLTGLRRQR
ncbi:MAG: hypothetical protein ABJD68_15935, partial [Nakamurella sp.]